MRCYEQLLGNNVTATLALRYQQYTQAKSYDQSQHKHLLFSYCSSSSAVTLVVTAVLLAQQQQQWK
jgi:hypothetical protein